MSDPYKRGLEQNIGKYSWYKVFTKRVYLPLITVYLASNGVTTREIGIIAFATAATQLSLQLPTGYLADKLGGRKVILFGSVVSAVSPMFYVLLPNFWGGLLATVFFFGGYAFVSGAVEAFMHDTLTELGKENLYIKVMGRAQSYGLIGNVVLLSLVPLTYTIDKRLPFIIGTFSLLINSWIAFNFTYPKRKIEVHKPNALDALRTVTAPRTLSVFILAGALTAIVYRGQEFRELAFQDVGIPVGAFGFIVAGSSLIAAVLGRYIHVAEKVSDNMFYFLNIVFLSLFYMGLGLTRNPWILIFGFVILLAYSRLQTIVITGQVLKSVKHMYKSTLISGLSMVDLIEELWVVSLITSYVGRDGYVDGHFAFGATIGVITLSLFVLHLLVHKKFAAN